MIDAVANRLLARIDADGQVGNVQYDPATGKVYVPVQSRDELIVIDPATLMVVGRHPLAGCKHPHGLAIVPYAAIGYVACDGNDRLFVVDLGSGRVSSSLAVAHDPDVLAIDRVANLLYVASESGNLSSFDIADAAVPRSLGDVFISADAHSVAVDPVTRRFYFPIASLDGRAMMRVFVPKMQAHP